MKEDYLAKRLKYKLEMCDFFTIKWNDESTIGLPDLSTSKRGHTIFLETKMVNRKKIPTEIAYSVPIKMGPQLMTMYQLSMRAEAYYVIGYNDALHVAVVDPIDVYKDVREHEMYGKHVYRPAHLVTLDEVVARLGDICSLWKKK